MQKQKYNCWNHIVSYVSDIYEITRKFKPGTQEALGRKIRKAAISISVAVNSFEVQEHNDFSRVYPIISSVSVLETYLQIAKNHRILKDFSVLEDRLSEVKTALYHLFGVQ